MPKPRKTTTFFLDRTIGKKVFAEALRQAGIALEIHDDHFPPDARDEVWLREVGRKGWVVVTNDRRIRYRAIELEALVASRARCFAFSSGNLTAQEMVEIFLRALPRVQRLLNKIKVPFVAVVTRDASVRLIFPQSLK